MNAHIGTNPRAMPPPVVEPRHGTASPALVRGTSPTVFVAKVVFAAIAIVMAATLVLLAPQVVTVPIAFVLVVGAVVSGLIVAGERWTVRRSALRTRRRGPSSTAGARAGPRPDWMHERRRHPRAGAADWRVLVGVAVVSIALLVLALLVPSSSERLGTALVISGLAGLVALRLAAARGAWVPTGALVRDGHSVVTRAR
jgi:hypothetical protein